MQSRRRTNCGRSQDRAGCSAHGDRDDAARDFSHTSLRNEFPQSQWGPSVEYIVGEMAPFSGFAVDWCASASKGGRDTSLVIDDDNTRVTAFGELIISKYRQLHQCVLSVIREVAAHEIHDASATANHA